MTQQMRVFAVSPENLNPQLDVVEYSCDPSTPTVRQKVGTGEWPSWASYLVVCSSSKRARETLSLPLR